LPRISSRIFRKASAGGPKLRPAVFLGCVETGVSSVTTPMRTARMSPTVAIVQGFRDSNPWTFAPRTGKEASEIRFRRDSWIMSPAASRREGGPSRSWWTLCARKESPPARLSDPRGVYGSAYPWKSLT
jgi:hypothetical protein